MDDEISETPKIEIDPESPPKPKRRGRGPGKNNKPKPKPKKRKKKKVVPKGPPKPRGRRRVCYEFLEARERVRNEHISSVGEYEKWWKLNTPARIPKRPDRAYKKEFITWNDYLGSNNPFVFIKRSFRGFVEGRQFAQQLGLKTRKEWYGFCTGGNKPNDIPTRPDMQYKEWYTWTDWLGADISAVKRNIEAAEAVFFILLNPGRQNNVFQLGVTLEGIETIKRAQQEHQFKVIGLFYCDLDFDWESMANRLGRNNASYGRSDEYTLDNVHDFIFRIGEFVEKVRS